MTIRTSQIAYRNWQAQKEKVSLENLPSFYETESELCKKAIESINLQEQENRLMYENSPRRKLIQSRSRCFEELTPNRGVNLESIINRLANLTAKINL